VNDARPVTEITYEEAAELAYFGAQVIILSYQLSWNKSNA
jgi:aspartokinase